MKNIIFVIAVVSMGVAITLAAMAFFPFFEIGYTSIANEYPNSKAYIVAVKVSDSGNPEEFYILGMDFTTSNALLVNVPVDLKIDGVTLSALYSKKGLEGVGIELSKTVGIDFTDRFRMDSTKIDEFSKKIERSLPIEKVSRYSANQETSGEALKLDGIMREIKGLGIVGSLGLYPEFSMLFDSTVTLPRFIRIAKFVDSSPKLSIVAYPVAGSGGSVLSDEKGLKNLAIELENCSPIHNPLSIKVEIVNNSNLSKLGFSYSTWNQWSKVGYDFKMVPLATPVEATGKSVVIDLSDSSWKKEAVRNTLKSFYPERKFTFTSTASPNVMKLYYEIIDRAAAERYYNAGNSDFIILLGN